MEQELKNRLDKIEKEIQKIKDVTKETLETLVALKMGVIGFDKIDNALKDIKRQLDRL